MNGNDENYEFYRLIYDFSIDLLNEIENLETKKYEYLKANNVSAENDVLSYIWFYACKDVIIQVNKLNRYMAQQLNWRPFSSDPDKWIQKVVGLGQGLFQWERFIHITMRKNVIDELANAVYNERHFYRYGKATLDNVFSTLNQSLI